MSLKWDSSRPEWVESPQPQPQPYGLSSRPSPREIHVLCHENSSSLTHVGGRLGRLVVGQVRSTLRYTPVLGDLEDVARLQIDDPRQYLP